MIASWKLSDDEIHAKLSAHFSKVRDDILSKGFGIMYSDYLDDDKTGFLYMLFPFGEKMFVKWIGDTKSNVRL